MLRYSWAAVLLVSAGCRVNIVVHEAHTDRLGATQSPPSPPADVWPEAAQAGEVRSTLADSDAGVKRSAEREAGQLVAWQPPAGADRSDATGIGSPSDLRFNGTPADPLPTATAAGEGAELDAAPVERVQPPAPPPIAESMDDPLVTGEPIRPMPRLENLPGPAGAAVPGLPPIANMPGEQPLRLEAIIDSVYQSYPLLEAAIQQRTVAAGQRQAATGAFDTQLFAGSDNGPVGFYRTFRQRVGVAQPLYGGGEVFAGYRVGRGSFEPWYKERQTNAGGEFSTGVAMPLTRNRQIDARRAELWQAEAGQRLVEPEINAQLIDFVQQASYAYWHWVAAGLKLRIAEGILEQAELRTEAIRRQVAERLLDPPQLADNQRLVAERRAARADAGRRLQQAAIRLGLFYRDADGQPLIPDAIHLVDFPGPEMVAAEQLAIDTAEAIRRRPELAALELVRRQVEIDLAQANNLYLPALDAVVSASQDVGFPATPLNDKGRFEMDAGLYMDVPVQRRMARGRIQIAQGKLAQLGAQRRMIEDQIAVDVQSAYAGLLAAYQQVQEAVEAVGLAAELARLERRKLQEGLSNVLNVALREQFAVEAAERQVDAMLNYYLAQADYRAAVAIDQL
jgi:outer membrane protein TolC